MGYVYLIGEIGNDNRYKIGSTKAKKVETRLKQLQTGNSSELYLKESFETEHPFKLEKMLHNHFKSSNLIGEWFELSEDDIKGFRDICEDKSKIIESLKENPFYFNLRIVPMKATDFSKPSSDGRILKKEILEEFLKKFDNGELMMFDMEHPELYD